VFFNRSEELAALNRLWRSDAAHLFILYGRRRVGKTELLQQFCRGKRAVYFLAAQVREVDNLRSVMEAIREAISDPLLDTLRFDRWEPVFTYLGQQAQSERLIVVLDEFQYLCDGNPALPSLLQRFWDLQGSKTRLFLVLCGSHVGFMEREVLAERSPLYGRRTGQQRLLPLSFRDSALFFPNYRPRDRALAYGLLGGMPAYLGRFDPRDSIRDNVIEQMLRPQGYLHDEVNFLLRTELKDPHTYASLLRAVADGCTRLNEVAQRAQVDATAAGKYLQVLRDLSLVRREVSAFERAPERRRRGTYAIEDNYVAFYFRFILPHLSLLASGAAEVVYDRFIAPHLNAYMGPIFEEVCRQYVQRHWGERLKSVPLRAGLHRDRDFDLDVVAPLSDGGCLIGECKWWERPVGENVLEALRVSVLRLPESVQRDAQLAIFSGGGFTDALRRRAKKEGVLLIRLEQMIGT
jgi:AAA+ ATPase superfamily predicted ATPase